MITQSKQPNRWTRHSLLLVLLITIGFNISYSYAKQVDDFNAPTRSAWEDADPANLPAAVLGQKGGKQADGKFTFSLSPIGQAYFVSSRKTSETYELKEGRTIEFRVDMLEGQGIDSFAVLGFIPQSPGPNSLAGYGIAKSESDILITKGINKYFYNENVAPPVKNNNVTLVLNLAVQNGNVRITGRVLDKDNGDRVIWEKSFIDTPGADVMSDGKDDPATPFLNVAGNFVLYLYGDGGKDPAGYKVVYDNAEAFVTDSVVLDDFNTADRTGWEDADPANLPIAVLGAKGGKHQNGQFVLNLNPIGQPYFVSSKKTTKTFELTEGSRHEFSVDMVSGRGIDSFTVLAWIPTSPGPNSLAGYGVAKSESDILITKGIGKYFYNENPTPALKNENVTLKLTLTVRSGKVEIIGQVLDRDKNNEIIFERSFIDTPAAEVMADGKDEPPGPYLTSGNVVLYLYADGGKDAAGYQVIYDNLVAAFPPSLSNEPPSISEISPGLGANFLGGTEKLSFKVSDDKNIPDSGIVVTLNGKKYTSASGLSLSPAGQNRVATLGGFDVNKDYSGEISVTDSDNVARSNPIFFDTFNPTTRLVEIEDYNFDSGTYFNNPLRSAEGSSADNSFTDRTGIQGVDYNETRTTPRSQDSIYRTQDPVRMAHTLDRRRSQLYDDSQNVWDYDVGDLASGEWNNYTREFPAGTYEVFLREAVINLAQGESVLERVTSAASTESQTVEILGSFVAKTSGFTFRNIPLTDGSGLNRAKVRLSGKTTLRLRTVTPDNDTGYRLLNYLAFVPVEDTGVQRAIIASLSPAADSTVETVSPKIEVTILNRDTRVDPASAKLTLNGVEAVGIKLTPTASGAALSYVLPTLPSAGSLNVASLSFKDNEGFEVKSEWQFTINYRFLDPATRISAKGKTPGFAIQVVQSPQDQGALENSLDRAENQLATGSSIARAVDTNAVVQLVNFSKRAGETRGYFAEDLTVPGIDPDLTGNGDNDFSVAMVTYLELAAGIHRFGLVTDDGYKVASGASPISRNITPIAFHNGGPADETVDFVVHQAGIYAFRMVWYERGGAGHAEWFSVDTQSGIRTLINDPNTPNSIKAWSTIDIITPSLTIESSPNVNGPYTADGSANIDLNAKSASIPVSNGNRFFRIRGASVTIKNATIQGANLRLSWQ